MLQKKMPCPIETLPVELQVMILSLASDIDTLASLLKATPRWCPAFASARQRILTTILKRTYDAEIFPEAVAAAKALMLPRRRLSPIERVGFVYRYHRSRTLAQFPENDLPTLILMCQLQRALHYHVQRFSEPAIQFIFSCAAELVVDQAHRDEMQAHITSALSSVEQVRLQRAFLRFQIYSRVFCNMHPTPDEKQALFAHLMPSWEVEEIASVYSYITRGIQQTFDLAEEDFMSGYTTEVGLAGTVGGVVRPREGTFDPCPVEAAHPIVVGQPQATASQPRVINRYDIRLQGDMIAKPSIHVIAFAEVRYQDRLKAHMLLSGLCFLRRLFESTGEARLALVSAKDDFSHSLRPPSMNALLDHSLMSIWANSHESATRDPDHPESSQQPTLTWQWAHKEDAYEDWSTGMFHELRRWGYPFWDVRRMQHSGIMEQRYVVW